MNFKFHNAFMYALVTTIFSMTAMANDTITSTSWVGVVRDADGFHTNDHNSSHSLTFTRNTDGKTFKISKDYSDLTPKHLSSEHTLLVKMDGYVTPRFLFFGGNLVVENAEILKQVDPVQHRVARQTRDFDRPRGRIK